MPEHAMNQSKHEGSTCCQKREKTLATKSLIQRTPHFSVGNMLGNKQVVHILFLCDDEHYDLFLFVLETVEHGRLFLI